MATVRDHYDQHLGPVYAWMLGDLDEATRRARTELEALGLGDGRGKVAIDLGAGPGVHSIALAQCGHSVVAIDSCAPLLDELGSRAGGETIRRRVADLTRFRDVVREPADLIVCMGDTLTHLSSRDAVSGLIEDVAAALTPGGVFVATFRDYVSSPLAGTSRFIPVRSDEERILTCFLESDEDVVTVHDVLHERGAAGWSMRVSAYPKLRLDPEWVRTELDRRGLACRRDAGERGMVRVVANRVA